LWERQGEGAIKWVKGEPLHVVAAFDSLTGRCFVITAYKPDLEYFESDYKARRQK